MKPEDKKILHKYDDYCSKNRFTYEHNNIHCYPRYQYNSICDDIINRYNCEPDPCCYRNYLYNRQPKRTYMYSNLSSNNNFDYNFKKVYPENLLHNTKYENCHVPSSQLNSQIPKYNSNLNYKRYFKNDDFTKSKKENINIENSGLNNIKNENSNININQKANEESNNININNNIEQENQENSKSNMKQNEDNNYYKNQNIPKKNYYHFNASYNNNYINDNISSYKPPEQKNNNVKKEIIINNSPCDYYYNTLHEEYLPKKEENIPLNNNRNTRRTYEIDSSRWNDNNSLFCHSSLLNDLVHKNCYNYDCYC